MAQDWITTLDHDLGGLHPDVATTVKKFLESLRTGFSGATAPASPVIGQPWQDTSGAVVTPRVYDGSTWRIVRAEPAATAPAEGVIRQAVIPGSGTGDVTVMESITQLVEVAAAATTSTTIEIPAGARVRSVGIRVAEETTTTATYSFGVTGAADRFGAGIAADLNTAHVAYGDETRYAAATPLLITPNATPGNTAARIRVVVNYELTTAPAAVVASPPE